MRQQIGIRNTIGKTPTVIGLSNGNFDVNSGGKSGWRIDLWSNNYDAKNGGNGRWKSLLGNQPWGGGGYSQDDGVKEKSTQGEYRQWHDLALSEIRENDDVKNDYVGRTHT